MTTLSLILEALARHLRDDIAPDDFSSLVVGFVLLGVPVNCKRWPDAFLPMPDH